MADLTFDITENLGVLSENFKGWTKEINLVSWNNRNPKFDIREWDELHVKMGKGVTLSKEEMIKLKEVLNSMNLEELEMD
ncbi:MAG TPA: PC4/YdbC family ssDNA-binding protein [Bacillota bacterium]|nr:PC4/YdbC family ssDNA-binding protein [Bacillota bacterium]